MNVWSGKATNRSLKKIESSYKPPPSLFDSFLEVVFDHRMLCIYSPHEPVGALVISWAKLRRCNCSEQSQQSCPMKSHEAAKALRTAPPSTWTPWLRVVPMVPAREARRPCPTNWWMVAMAHRSSRPTTSPLGLVFMAWKTMTVANEPRKRKHGGWFQLPTYGCQWCVFHLWTWMCNFSWLTDVLLVVKPPTGKRVAYHMVVICRVVSDDVVGPLKIKLAFGWLLHVFARVWSNSQCDVGQKEGYDGSTFYTSWCPPVLSWSITPLVIPFSYDIYLR